MKTNHKPTDIAFYISGYYSHGESGGNYQYPVYYSEIKDELNAGFTLEEIKKMYNK